MNGELGVGSQFGPYRLTRLVGSGGMGSVFEAEDTVLGRSVALKLISASYAQDPAYRQRLEREARIAGRLRDPHVVPIHGAGEIDGQLYVDMRLIDGVDLDTTLEREGRLSPPRAVAIVSQIASALDAAHAAGVLHRDVKPANILLTANDFAYLVDFGIANAAAETKLTQRGDVLGTWAYMAPERFGGDGAAVTASADVYALACVLFEALTGSRPFTGDRVSVSGAHLLQPPPRPSVVGGIPVGLDEVIARGMAKQPAHRYATAGALARAAQAALGGGVVSNPASPIGATTQPWRSASPAPPTRPPATWSPGGPPPGVPPSGTRAPSFGVSPDPPGRVTRRRWPLVAAAASLVVVLAVGVVIWTQTGGTAKQPAAAAVDLGSLDVGRYDTQPRPLPATATEEEGRYLAGYRLAESVVNPYDVDPMLDDIVGAVTPDPKLAATFVSATGSPVIEPVLRQYGMQTSYTRIGQSDHSPGVGFRQTLTLLVTAYRNADAASRAATAIDDVDFAVNPNNQRMAIPGYPQAHAHYDPADSSMVATLATGSHAVTINWGQGGVTKRDDYFDDLAVQIGKVLDLQAPMLSDLTPFLDIVFTQLPPDPDDMLRRAFVAGEQPPISGTHGTLGPRAVITCQGPAVLKAGLFEKAGVDRCAITPDGNLLRARDDAAAEDLLPRIVDANRQTRIDRDIAPPDGVDNAHCYEQKQSLWKDRPNARFACAVTFGRYVAFVRSAQEDDVRQRGAAQYAILVNSA